MLPKGANQIPVDLEGSRKTYSALVVNFTPAATATDFFTLTPVAGTIMRVNRVRIMGTITGSANSIPSMTVYRRNAVNTGGSTAAVTPVPHDSNDPASTVVAVSYTANPAGLGTGVIVREEHFMVVGTTTPTQVPVPLLWDSGLGNGKSWTFRGGKGEFLALNWQGQAVPAGLLMHVTVEYTEEAE